MPLKYKPRVLFYLVKSLAHTLLYACLAFKSSLQFEPYFIVFGKRIILFGYKLDLFSQSISLNLVNFFFFLIASAVSESIANATMNNS